MADIKKNFVSYEDATELMTEIGDKFKALNGAYVLRGSVTFANLPSVLTKTMTGYVYNVTDDFTTDARFIEGAGLKEPLIKSRTPLAPHFQPSYCTNFP